MKKCTIYDKDSQVSLNETINLALRCTFISEIYLKVQEIDVIKGI